MLLVPSGGSTPWSRDDTSLSYPSGTSADGAKAEVIWKMAYLLSNILSLVGLLSLFRLVHGLDFMFKLSNGFSFGRGLNSWWLGSWMVRLRWSLGGWAYREMFWLSVGACQEGL